MSKLSKLLTCASIALTIYSGGLKAQVAKPTEIQITAYRTTVFANGKDEVLIFARLIDNKGKEVPGITKHFI